MQVNVKTIIVVVLLSMLVWVFAERAVVKTAMLEVEIELFSNSPEYFVQYLDEQNEPTAETSRRIKINVKGPAGRIQSLQEGKLIPRVVRSDVETQGYTELAGQEYRDFTAKVLVLLNGRVAFEDQTYLVAEEAIPAVLPIRVTKLLPVSLSIQVVDENDMPLPQERIESIEPEQIQAYVAGGATNYAKVILNASQQQNATQQPITVNARIPGLAHPEGKEVKIKLMKETTTWPIKEIDRPRVGICNPPSMEGKYRIIPEDLEDRLELDYKSIKFTGPETALKLFENSKFHLILYIADEDIADMGGARKLEYNIPKGVQIVNPSTTSVRFRLEKIGE